MGRDDELVIKFGETLNSCCSEYQGIQGPSKAPCMEIWHPVGAPLGKGEATCYSSWLYSFMYRRYMKVTTRVHRVMEWQRTLYLLRKESLHCDQPVSQYSISLRTHHSVTSWDVIDQCWPECGVLISSTSYSGFCLSLVQLIAWAEDTCIGSTLRLFIVSSTLRSLFSPSDENIQLETLGEEFGLAGSIWWGEHIRLWVLGQRDALVLWGQWPYWRILLVWEFGVMRCYGIVGTIPTSLSSWSTDHISDSGLYVFIVFWDDFVYRFCGRHCPSATLLYIVDWLLQWSKDFSDTTVFGWPTLWMSNRTFCSTLRFEAVRCYLYVENWFEEGTLRSDYVLHTEEGCTDTLCESLRSWEANGQR